MVPGKEGEKAKQGERHVDEAVEIHSLDIVIGDQRHYAGYLSFS